VHHRAPGHSRESHDETLLVTVQLVVLAVLVLTVAHAIYRGNTVPDLSPDGAN
jgi:hypothetical protein